MRICTCLFARRRAAMPTQRMWPYTQRTLNVHFVEGEPVLHRRVIAAAQEWDAFSGVRFTFLDYHLAQIRVGFRQGQGSWSYVGSDALWADSDITINFGWLTPDTDEAEVRRVVLHEFGHALGLIHEHQNPTAEIPWDREAVYRFYAGPPNFWSRQAVDANLFDTYARDNTNFTAFDSQSIMLYPISAAMTGGRLVVGWNGELSLVDRQFIADAYPAWHFR